MGIKTNQRNDNKLKFDNQVQVLKLNLKYKYKY
jgi:hypothetical protein